MKKGSIPRRPDVPRPPDLPDRPDRGGGGWSRRRMAGLLVVTVLVMLASLAGIAVVAPTTGPEGASTSRGPEYAFLYATVDGPHRWDPCLPIHYEANVTDAPDGVIDDLDEVIDRLEGDTGIEFVFDGLTERTDREQQRSAFLRPNVADARPLPVLVTWVPPQDFRRYANPDRYAGVGQPVRALGAFDEYRSGIIVINTGGLRLGFTDRGSNGVILQHEWGHVLGLGHVRSRDELMWSPDVEGAAASPDPWLTDWGPGDMDGLRALGRQAGCLS